MATTSYPAVGDGGLTDDQWSIMYGAHDGIIEDYSGNTLSMFRASSTDMCQVSAGKVSINGYVLEITATESLYCAPVVHPNPPVTYYVAAMYDPALNVAEPGGERSELGPCRLVITTDLDTGGGKEYFVLYRLIRSSIQTLNETEVSDFRRWIGPSIQVSERTAYGNPSLPPGETWPRGTIMRHHSTSNEWHRVPNAAGTALEWLSTAWPPTYNMPIPSSLTAMDTTATYYRLGCQVHLFGTIRRASGSLLSQGGRDVTLATMPTGYQPLSVQRFQCPTDGTGDVEIKCFANGEITMSIPAQDVLWVDLSPVSYRARMGG